MQQDLEEGHSPRGQALWQPGGPAMHSGIRDEDWSCSLSDRKEEEESLIMQWIKLSGIDAIFSVSGISWPLFVHSLVLLFYS